MANRNTAVSGLCLVLVASVFSVVEGAACPDGPVIIVGAGVSGLSAAETLSSFGCEYVVLEASTYVGGRTLSLRSGDFAGQDVGAHWIHGGATNPILAKVVGQLGLSVVKVGVEEDGVTENVRLHDVDGQVVSQAQVDRGYDLVEEEYGELEDLQAQRDTQGLPDISVQEGLDAIAGAAGHSAFDQRLLGWWRSQYYEGDEGVSPSEIGLRSLMEDDYVDYYTGGNSGDQIIVGGFSNLVDAYVAASNINVTLNTVVTHVSLVGDTVVVTTEAGTTVEGAAVIVTVPVSVLQDSGIEFSPALSSGLTQSFSQISQGSFAKVMLKFSTTFWSTSHYTEGFMSGDLDNYGRFPLFVNSVYETAEGANILVCYIGGNMSKALNSQTDNEVVAEAVQVLETMFPDASPITPVASLVKRWDSHPFVNGAWSHVNVGGSGTVARTMANPLWSNRLAFAGEHSCYLLLATVHGALVSGVRAAAAVLGATGETEGEGLLWEFRDRCEERPSKTPTASRSASVTASRSTSASVSPTASVSASVSPTASVSASVSPTALVSPTASASPSVSASSGAAARSALLVLFVCLSALWRLG